MGHVDYLSGKCDCILVPYIDRYSKTDSLCANFYGIYDLAKTIFPDRIIHYHIDLRHNERRAYIKMAQDLGFNKTKAALAYDKAKSRASDLKEKAVIENKELLKNSKKIKILLVGHLYNVYDDFVGSPIISYLNKNKVDVIYAHLNNANPKAYKKISESLYWKYNKELLNGLVTYEKDIDGVILLTTFPCGPDSLVNELCLGKVTKPTIGLIVDELNSGTGLETRLESFVDILEQRKGDEL